MQDIILHNRIEVPYLELDKGQNWHLLGANGAGKSSLLAILGGIITPDSGVVTFKQNPLSNIPLIEMAKTRAYLQQNLHCEFDIPAKQLLSFYTPYSVLPAIVDEHLQLNSLLHKPLSKLSGGQQQRFYIALAILQVWTSIKHGEALLLLDEPLQQLDPKYQSAVLRLLQAFSTEGNTVVCACHDVNLSSAYASHVALLYERKVFRKGATSKILNLDNINHIFDHTFIEIDNGNNASNSDNSKALQKTNIRQKKFFSNASNSIL